MILSDTKFKKAYSKEFETQLSNVESYIEHPELLRCHIAEETKIQDKKELMLPFPRPDEFLYRMIRYKGFKKYPERLRNYIVAQNSVRSETCDFIPTILDIEPTSRCNFRCTMCQLSEWEHGKRAEDLSFSKFKAIADEQYGLVEVKLQGLGEPLFNKEFIKMIEYLVNRYIWVRTTLNGSLLDKNELYKDLVDSGVNEIINSFDGATKEVFEKIRVRSNFNRVVENFTLLNDYANREGKLITRMWVLLQDNNRHQLLNFVDLAKRMGYRRLTFSIGLSDWGQEKWKEKISVVQVQKSLTEREIELLLTSSATDDLEITYWDLSQKYSIEKVETLCSWPFTRAYVSSDMRVVSCCMIANPDIVDFGDANNFTKTWNNESIRNFRRAHLEGKIPEFCRNCYV